jgi:organic hydroperoxide reductase OsmC/OhrA
LPRTHTYQLTVTWTGERATDPANPRGYGRAHEVAVPGRAPLPASADPAMDGDADRWNPEELLVAAISQCHMLWFLHLAAGAGVTVTAYTDRPQGVMIETRHGGHFTEVTLRPVATVAAAEMVDQVAELHEAAHRACFIANSVNFPVKIEPIGLVDQP